MTVGVRVLTFGRELALSNYELRHVENVSSIISAIAEFQPDVIVSSVDVPEVLNEQGLELRKRWIHVDSSAPLEEIAQQIDSCYAFNLWSAHPGDRHQPLVSVYTPTFDAADYLRQTYQSLRDQSYPNWEWVVVDDHSADGTWQLLEALAREDERVRPFRSGKHLGKIGQAKGIATRLARGEYLVELDHDDLLTDFALAEIVRAFGKCPDVGMVYSNCCSFYEDGSFQKFDDDFWSQRYRFAQYRDKSWLECVNPDIYDRFGANHTDQFAWFLTVGPHHVRAFRATTFRELGGYNERLPVADDWDLYARFFLRSKCLHIDKMLYLYRYRDNFANTTFRKNQEIQEHLALGRGHYAEEFRAFNARRPKRAEGVDTPPAATIGRPSSGDDPLIRVIAIAKNEEAAVRAFFEQFRAVTRDWCLLDTGSTDSTANAAAALGVRVERARFVDFASARNEALARFAKRAEWILMLDLDERIDGHTIGRLKALMEHASCDVYLAPLEAVSPDGTRRAFVPKPFLFRNAEVIRWVLKVHEKLIGGKRQALVRNARIDHVLSLHDDERRGRAEAMYRHLMTSERYFTDDDYRRQLREAWPILDYDHLDDARLAKIEIGPLVSVVIPTYRRARALNRAVRSVLAQDYAPFEVLVVGDGCPELNVQAFSTEPRVRAYNLPENHGPGGAFPRNHAIEIAAGELIAYLDDDNIWQSNHLSSLVRELTNTGASFAFSSMQVDGHDLGFARPKLGGVDTSCLVHRRALISKYGGWKPREQAGYAHDWEIVKRWMDGGEPWTATCQPTLEYNATTSGQASYLSSLLTKFC